MNKALPLQYSLIHIYYFSFLSLPYLGGIYLLWAYSGTIPPETSGWYPRLLKLPSSDTGCTTLGDLKSEDFSLRPAPFSPPPTPPPQHPIIKPLHSPSKWPKLTHQPHSHSQAHTWPKNCDVISPTFQQNQPISFQLVYVFTCWVRDAQESTNELYN